MALEPNLRGPDSMSVMVTHSDVANFVEQKYCARRRGHLRHAIIAYLGGDMRLAGGFGLGMQGEVAWWRVGLFCIVGYVVLFGCCAVVFSPLFFPVLFSSFLLFSCLYTVPHCWD